MKKIALALMVVFLLPIGAKADGMPGLRGSFEFGFTVPDLEQAVDFFVDVIGCESFFTASAVNINMISKRFINFYWRKN